MSTKVSLYLLHILTRGLQISLLVVLPFLQKDLNISLVDIGLLSALLTVTAIISAFFAGDIQGRFGTKNVILFSILIYAVSWIGFLFVRIPGVLWFIYAFGGTSSGLFDPIANAVIARNASPAERGKEIGNYSAMGDLGRIGATTVTSMLVGLISWTASSILYSVFAFGIFLFFFFYDIFPKIHIKSKHTTTASLYKLIRHRKYMLAVLAGVLDTLSSVSLFIFLPFLLIPKGIDLEQTGLFTALFFVGFFAGRVILGRIADKHGAAKILIATEICMALLIISLVFITAYWLLVINLFFLGVVARGTSPVVKAMIAEGLEDHEFEKGFSFYSSSVRTAIAVSRTIFGFVGALFGIESVFYLCGFVALLTIIPAVLTKKST